MNYRKEISKFKTLRELNDSNKFARICGVVSRKNNIIVHHEDYRTYFNLNINNSENMDLYNSAGVYEFMDKEISKIYFNGSEFEVFLRN